MLNKLYIFTCTYKNNNVNQMKEKTWYWCLNILGAKTSYQLGALMHWGIKLLLPFEREICECSNTSEWIINEPWEFVNIKFFEFYC